MANMYILYIDTLINGDISNEHLILLSGLERFDGESDEDLRFRIQAYFNP